MKIEIVNFAKYNPRDDIKNPTWLRLDRDWWQDEALIEVSDFGIRIWFVLLGLVKGKTGQAEFNPLLIARVLDRDVKLVLKEIDNFAKLGRITIESDRIRTDTDGSVRERTDLALTGRTGRDGTDGQTANPCRPISVAVAPVPPNEPKGTDVWSAYRASYFARYRVEPVRNARSNSLCKKLVDRLGGDGAIGVVKFFLTHGKSFYVAKAHDLALCIADAEGLHTQMLAGHRITSSEAAAADKTSANQETFENVAKRMEARRLAKEIGNAGE